jgi:hypothetical protein
MPKDVTILATDLTQTILMDKSGFGYAFCNPPYSQFADFPAKAINEIRCSTLYLVIPDRWVNSQLIQEAIKGRKAEVEVLGSFDFNDAEVRKARAKVQLIKVTLGSKSLYSSSIKVDPFDSWLDAEFPVFTKTATSDKFTRSVVEKERLKEKLDCEMVKGGNLIETLEQLYLQEMNELMHNYKRINELDYELLKEMNVDTLNLKDSMKTRITGLKTKYWEELFSNYKKITTRLTSSKRKMLLEKLSSRTNIDFSVQNALAVTIYVLKNASDDLDEQLLEVYGKMVKEVNIENYISNQTIFSEGQWGWRRKPENLTHFKLLYRMVVDNQGGISTSEWGYENTSHNGLTASAANFISDLMVIARNLGFDPIESYQDFQWVSGKKHRFTCVDAEGKSQLICEFKAFKKGSIHLRMGEDFGIALNIEHGRLKSWIRDSAEAAYEMELEPEKAAQYFKCNYDIKQLKTSEFLLEMNSPDN